MMNKIVCLLAFWALVVPGFAQQTRPDTLSSQGGWVRREIIDGDTTYLATLRTVKISKPRQYANDEERRKLNKYRRYAANVYPMAQEIIDLYNELQAEKEDMSRRAYRRFARGKKKELKTDWEHRLRNLYETEGKILVKMIERQTGTTFYTIMKEYKGTASAMYWQNIGRIGGFNFKEGYVKGVDPLMDEVLLDYDFGEAIWKY